MLHKTGFLFERPAGSWSLHPDQKGAVIPRSIQGLRGVDSGMLEMQIIDTIDDDYRIWEWLGTAFIGRVRGP